MSAAVIAVVLLLAALAVVWSRRRTWLRAVAVPGAMLAGGIACVILLESLGYAVPLISGLTLPSGEQPVISAKFLVQQGIFLTVDLPAGPRLYWLPWDRQLADKLQEMMDQAAQGQGGGVMMDVPPFELSLDHNAPQFRELPQPKVLPDKPPEPPAAPHFDA